jgi:hypothetical protein
MKTENTLLLETGFNNTFNDLKLSWLLYANLLGQSMVSIWG